MDPIIHLVTNKLRLRQDTTAGKVYLERFEDGVWVTRAEVDAVAGEAGWAKYLGLTAAELKAVPEPEGAAHGDILFRGATAWTRLPAGQAGYFLKTQGPGADPVWVEPPAGGAGARTATVIVAAADSSARSKQGADYVVPEGSTSAQTVINQAIGDLPTVGGKVVVLEGTYIVDNSILIPSNVHLEIMQGATIKARDGAPTAFDIITNADTTSGNTNIRVSGGGTIDGNKANNTQAIGGIYFRLVTNAVILGLTLKDLGDYAIYLSGGAFLDTVGNKVTNAAYGIRLGNTPLDVAILGNYISGTNNPGIYLEGVTGFKIIGNTVTSVTNSTGIEARTNSVHGLISGNICKGNLNGILLNGCHDSEIVANVLHQNSYDGINVLACNRNIIANNYCRLNGQYGITCTMVKDSVIAGNICRENSQTTDNTYDNVYLTTDSDNNLIQGNMCRRGTQANQPRYGLRIDASTCDTNAVINNDCFDSGKTAGISDAGTGTIFGPGNRINNGTWSSTPG